MRLYLVDLTNDLKIEIIYKMKSLDHSIQILDQCGLDY